MTSFMLINPFATLNAPTQPTATQTAQPATTVQAIHATTNNAQKGDSATYSGSDTARQQSDQADKMALFQNRTTTASGDATPKSVVNAQAYKGSDTDRLGNTLPEVVMPDPLPTSPFLKRG